MALLILPFSDFITVYRISQTIDKNGRVLRFKRAFTNVAAVVTPTAPADLHRLPHYELMNKSMSVCCPEFRLGGVIGEGIAAERPVKRAKAFAADQQLWAGR
jgi:hypothetical protein